MSTLPHISLVVIGRNEGERLVRCLQSIRAADYPQDQIELLYVDSGSRDGSPERAAELGARVIVLDLERPTAAAGRNAGYQAATHDLVQFMDGDTELYPQWLRQAVETMSDPQATCVFGRVVERNPERSIYNRWAHYDWHVTPGEAESCGGIAMFRRAALQQVGGYDATLTAGEERDLCYRLKRDAGARLMCRADEMVSHDIDITHFGQYWKRCRRVGHAYAEVSGRYPDLHAWRATCRRNTIHSMLLLAALIGTAWLRSPWPLAAWLLLVIAIVVRNASRLRKRLPNVRESLLLSLHHYVSKFPTFLGQIEFYLRRMFGTRRRATSYRAAEHSEA